jgi:outer membrane receptor for ferrienterochelin and colicins
VQNVNRSSYYGAGKDPDAYGKTTDLTSVSGVQYSYRMSELWFMPATLTLGSEYLYNHLNDMMPGYNRETNQRIHLVGAFAQNEWRNERMSILLGARLDKHSIIRNPILSPRVNLRYMLLADLNLRASYSSGYRAPQTFDEDLHVEAVNGNVALISNSYDLKPERSQSVSASADYTFELFGMPVNILAEGFYTTLNDVFMLQDVGVDASGNILKERHNASGATVKGVNLEARAILTNWLQLQMGYTFQRSLYRQAESWSADTALATRTMLRSPNSYGYFTAQLTPLRDLSTSLSGVYTGSMLMPHAEGYIERDANRTTPDFFDLSARVSYSFRVNSTMSIQLNVGVQNIFNSFQTDFDQGANRDAGYIYGPTLPRTFFVGVKLGVF